MSMNAVLFAELILAAFSGVLLGCLYFGGLWLTVRQAPNWQHPGLGMLASLFLRLALVGIGLYLMADGHWQRYAAALPGLLIARWWWVRRIEVKKATL
jgi:F1F0 ATPase subunit 2